MTQATTRNRILVMALLVLIIAACSPSPPPTQTPVVPSSQPSPTPMPTLPPITPTPPSPSASTLQRIRERKGDEQLIKCGVATDRPGFSAPENGEQGAKLVGMDVDFCKALAVAIFNDENRVELKPLAIEGRFEAVRKGVVDVAFRFTTDTIWRGATHGESVDFGPVYYYDGLNIMVRKTSGITKVSQLSKQPICVRDGTTAPGIVRDRFSRQNLDSSNVLAKKSDPEREGDDTPHFRAYENKDCVAVIAERSQLLAHYDSERDLLLADSWLSKEPIAPIVQQNDSQWRDIVAAVIYATFQAEEFVNLNSRFAVRQGQIAALPNDVVNDPEIGRFLGILDVKCDNGTNIPNDFGNSLDLPNDFAKQIIDKIGNYKDIYNRHFGEKSERGPNKMWNDPQGGGLLVAPPIGAPSCPSK